MRYVVRTIHVVSVRLPQIRLSERLETLHFTRVEVLQLVNWFVHVREHLCTYTSVLYTQDI